MFSVRDKIIVLTGFVLTGFVLTGFVLFAATSPLAAADDSKLTDSKLTDSKLIVLKKGNIEMFLSEPGDARNHRGTRFDHSGMVHSIRFGEHQLCQRWHAGALDPDKNDDVTGPCEEFGNRSPLGYIAKKPGSHFVKIGVGVLRQPEEPEYRFWGPYEFVKRGEWTTTHDADSMTFHQILFDDDQTKSIGYDYRKTIQLTESGFRIDHTLANIGQHAWSTDHYNHNFFLVDSDPVGPSYELQLAFKIRPDNVMAEFAAVAEVSDQTVRYLEDVGARSFFAELMGHRRMVSDNWFQLRHKPTRITIECQGNKPLSKFNFWGTKSTICPEPFIEINLEPGQTSQWAWDYTLR